MNSREENFYLEESLVTAEKLRMALADYFIEPLPAQIIISDMPSHFNRIKQESGFQYRSILGIQSLTTRSKNVGLVLGLGMGGPAVAMTLELLKVLGARRIIHLGTAGSLNQQMEPGTLLFVDGAYRDEGTSLHYLSPSPLVLNENPSAQRWFERIKEKLIPCHRGVVWTTDAVFRETKSSVEKFRHMGADAVEMEAAAVFAVAQKIGLESLCLRVISDQLTSESWIPQYTSAKVRRQRQSVLQFLMSEDWPV